MPKYPNENQELTEGPLASGLIAWSRQPAAFTGTAPAAGTLNVVKVNYRGVLPFTINNIILGVVTAGATMTAGQNFAGVYDCAGVKVAQTADMSTTWNSVGYKVMPVQTPVLYHQPWIWVAWYSRAATVPQFARDGVLANANFGLTGTACLLGTANTGLTTALPTPLGAITLADTQFFAAIS